MTDGQAPFVFEVEGVQLVDHANGLRICCYQWPEYNFTITVEPSAGEQAEAWPVAKRAYFEFRPVEFAPGVPEPRTLSMALVHEPFERDFPGRFDELLDVVIPMIIPMDLWTFPRSGVCIRTEVPAMLRRVLDQRRSYFRHRDERDTDGFRQSTPIRKTWRDTMRQFLRNAGTRRNSF